jgi:hypothetical protein
VPDTVRSHRRRHHVQITSSPSARAASLGAAALLATRATLQRRSSALAEHFSLAARTGTLCVYEPPSRDRIVWVL